MTTLLSQEFIAKLNKKGLSLETIQQKTQDFETIAMELMGLTKPEDIKSHIIKCFGAFTTKKEYKGATTEIEYVAIGARVSDYGAQRKYDAAIEAFKKDPKEAIEQELVNAAGHPLRQSKFGGDKIISAINGKVTDLTKQYTILWRTVGSDSEFSLGELTTRNKQYTSTVLFALQKQTVAPNAKVENKFMVIEQYVPETIQTLTNAELKELLMRFMPNNIVRLNDDFAIKVEQLKEGYQPAVFIGDLVGGGFTLTAETAKSNSMTLMEPLTESSDIDDIRQCTVWMDKEISELPNNIQDGAMDIIVVGRANVSTKDGGYTINAAGVYVPPQFKVTQDAAPVSPDTPAIEVADENEFI